MAADVYTATSDYLKQINDFITPVLVPTPLGKQRKGKVQANPVLDPDKLGLYQRVLMNNYRNAVAVFQPVRQSCSSTSQCEQGEECIDGVCTPVNARASFVSQSCTRTSDCEQGEECIDFVCVPLPFDVIFEDAVGQKTSPPAGPLNTALSAYANKIHAVIVTGLGRDKSKLYAVRAMLMQAYLDVITVAGNGTPCHDSTGCGGDEICMDGYCVPVPFRLVFRPLGG